jgi:RNA polymerase sigma factor
MTLTLIKIFSKETPVEELVLTAKSGDSEARNNLIKKYTPFIVGVIGRYLNKYVNVNQDEEAIIGMEAFNQAIDSYDMAKGQSFLAFSRVVIQRRLIDHLRKKDKYKHELPMTFFEEQDEEGSIYNSIDNKIAIASYRDDIDNIERRQDIELFKEILREYKITLEDLVELSPKHEDARLRAIEVSKIIYGDITLTTSLLTNKTLPLIQLQDRVSISRKTLERQRKYIIAIALILINDLTYLRHYIKE